jgi:hypothetical protein
MYLYSIKFYLSILYNKMPVKLNINSVEKFTEHKANNSNDPENAVNLPVDHCSLRPLSEVYSTMCEPTPIPTTIPPPVVTTKCIKPAVTLPTYVDGTCVLYKYDSPKNIINEIRDKGYYIFRNMIPKNELEIAKEYFYDNKVNYNKLFEMFIKPSMLEKVGNQIDKKLVTIKYRASNNNLSDANAFHRGLHIKSGEKRVSNHSVITYIDGGIIEIIPTSNRKQNIDIMDVKEYYDMREEVHLNPGDVLIFEMAIIHRDSLYKQKSPRRIIQLFDTVFEEDLDYFLKTVLHIPCGKECNASETVFNQNKLWSNLINTVSYYNAALGYSKLPIDYITSEKGVKYISTEDNQSRIEIEDNTFQNDNKYISNFKTIDISKDDVIKYKFISFVLNNILTILLVIIIILILILMIGLSVRN